MVFHSTIQNIQHLRLGFYALKKLFNWLYCRRLNLKMLNKFLQSYLQSYLFSYSWSQFAIKICINYDLKHCFIYYIVSVWFVNGMWNPWYQRPVEFSKKIYHLRKELDSNLVETSLLCEGSWGRKGIFFAIIRQKIAIIFCHNIPFVQLGYPTRLAAMTDELPDLHCSRKN